MATGGGGHDLSRSQLNAGDELFDHHCTPCQKRNKNRAASKYCGVCLEYMCAECVKNHNSFKSLSKHVLVDIALLQVSSGKGKSSHLLSVPTEMCRNHPMKVVDMYCENDDCVGCSVCIAPHYSSCAGIHYIPEYVKSIAVDAKHILAIEIISACIEDVSALKKHKNNMQKNIAKEKGACKTQMQSFRMEIKKVVDNLEQKSLIDLDKKYQKLNEEIANEIKRIEAIEKELVRLKREMEVTSDNDSQQFAITKVSQEMIKESVKLTRAENKVENTTLHFVENIAIMQQLKQFESLQKSFLQTPIVAFPASQSLAELTSPALKSARKTFSPTWNNQANLKSPGLQTSGGVKKGLDRIKMRKENASQRFNREVDIGRLYDVIIKSEPSVRISSDREVCSITSVCILDTGNLMLSDRNNRTIKLFDMTIYEVTDFLKLSSTPNRICRVNGNEVAVSMGDQCIQFISTKDKLSTIREINMKYNCVGLVIVDNKLYVCDQATSVHVYTMKGELIKTIQYRSATPSRFNTLSNDIALNDDGTVVFTCDPEGLSAIDLEGKGIWQHNNDDETKVKRLTGVCCDGRGHLFVSGSETNNVVILNDRGMFIKEIVRERDGLKGPAAISFHKKKKELIVAMPFSDAILIFTF